MTYLTPAFKVHECVYQGFIRMSVYFSSLCSKSLFFVMATDILSPGLDLIGKRTWRIHPEVFEFAALGVIFETGTHWSSFYYLCGKDAREPHLYVLMLYSI